MNIIETNLQFKSMSIRKSTNRILLHHADASECTAEDIHSWHLAKDWSGAGYHFLVRKDGSIYILRPEQYVGAHARGSNSDSIGICFEGRYNIETMPEAQIKAGQELIAYIKNKYSITLVQKHSDVCATDCPGKNFPFEQIVNETTSTTVNTTVQNTVNNTTTGTIATIQSTLNSRYGFNIAVDNLYGNETKEALIKALQTELNVQYNKGLAVDGIFGTNTYNACVNVRQGAQGNITYILQAILHCKGYNTNGVDGIFGSVTASAVRQFQKDNGLSVDRVAGKNTFKKLFA